MIGATRGLCSLNLSPSASNLDQNLLWLPLCRADSDTPQIALGACVQMALSARAQMALSARAQTALAARVQSAFLVFSQTRQGPCDSGFNSIDNRAFVLPGVHWCQTSKLDGPINCSERVALVDARGIHAWLDFVMFHCEFLGCLNEVFPCWFRLASC
jgi:hypothetical protein